MDKKLTLILLYLGVWTLIILEYLYIAVLSYHKSRIAVALQVGLLLVILPYILFKVLTEFGMTKNSKWYSIIISGFLFAIVYGIWTNKIDTKRLQDDSQETKGVVYKAWTSRRKHLVRIRYTIGSKNYTTFSDTDHKKELLVGDTVTVSYWRSNPDLYKVKEFWN